MATFRALNNTNGSGQDEGQDYNGEACASQHVAKGLANTGIHQNLLEHTAGTGYQDDDACWLQSGSADVHHFILGVAAFDTQQVAGSKTGNHDGSEWVANKCQPAVDR
nr:hypothetical protein [Endozoicomonas sp. SCSIO W0465]